MAIGRWAVVVGVLIAVWPTVDPVQRVRAAQTGPAAGLRILVIEGEDAVNIIQQKTAVAPIVEVRDRNDLPVSGAAVTFTISGSNTATFAGGAQTLTVTTNAAGRAVVGALNPLGSGAFQINVQAAFQGQTAVAAIAQTNVLTAAEAAAASGAGAAGGSSGGTSTSASAGAGGGGGGLSGTTIGIVGGAAAAGTVLAVKEVIGGTVYRGQFSGTMLVTNLSLTGQPTCVHNEQQTGVLEMSLEDKDGTITGTAEINDGKLTRTPGTCLPSRFNDGTADTFGLGRGQLAGSRESLTLSANQSNNWTDQPTGNTGVNSYDYSFTGTFDGTQVTGTLTITRIVTCNCNPNPTRGTITYNVTLR